MYKKTLLASFGNRLRDERTRLNYTQEKLADLLNVRQQTIYKYEKNITFPGVDFLYLLPEVGFDLEYLIFAVPTKNILDVPSEVLITISKLVKDFELKFDVGTFSDKKRLQVSLIYLDHYFQNPSIENLSKVSTLDLLLNRSV